VLRPIPHQNVDPVDVLSHTCIDGSINSVLVVKEFPFTFGKLHAGLLEFTLVGDTYLLVQSVFEIKDAVFDETKLPVCEIKLIDKLFPLRKDFSSDNFVKLISSMNHFSLHAPKLLIFDVE